MPPKKTPTTDLKTIYAAKLASSGLTPAAARACGYTLLTAEAVKALGHRAVPALHIPYHTAAGQPTGFYRIRYLEGTRRGFAAQTTAKDQRYDQPQKQQPQLYLPQVWKRSWTEEFTRETALIITEGELKAACAAAHGLPTMALGGVWNFCARKAGVSLLPIFDAMNLQNRQVFIIFDSDAVTNPQVAAAENALCKELCNKKAEPAIVRLPSLDGHKTGLDDYIVAQGVEALKQLIEAAEPYKLGAELHKMNEEVVYVENPSLVLRHSDGYKMAVGTFKNEVYANRTFIDFSGEKPKQVKTAEEWVRWQGRATVNKFVYEPGQHGAGHTLNLWSGLPYAPVQGNVKPWHMLMDYVFADDPTARRWFEAWLAYPLQHLGVKLFTAVVMWGVAMGTGKTLIGHTMQRLYGPANSIMIRKRDLLAGGNTFAENKQFILGEEITGSEKRDMVSELNSLITNEEMRINIKYVPEYSIRSCANYYFTSNNPDAFFLDEADRRFFVHEIVGSPLPEEWYTGVYDPWYKSDAGAAALLHYLLNIDTSGFNPMSRAPMTAAKAEMIESSRSALSMWVHDLRDNPDKVLKVGAVTITYALYTNEDLLKIYDPEGKSRVGTRALGVELKRARVPRAAGGSGCRLPAGQCRLWAVREVSKYGATTPKAAAEAYSKEREKDEKVAKFSKEGAKK